MASMASTRTRQGYVALYGTPVFSLVCVVDGKKIHTDMSGYRPDPRDWLQSGKNYKAIIELQRESILDIDIWIPRHIRIENFHEGSDNLEIIYIR